MARYGFSGNEVGGSRLIPEGTYPAIVCAPTKEGLSKSRNEKATIKLLLRVGEKAVPRTSDVPLSVPFRVDDLVHAFGSKDQGIDPEADIVVGKPCVALVKHHHHEGKTRDGIDRIFPYSESDGPLPDLAAYQQRGKRRKPKTDQGKGGSGDCPF